MLVGTKRHHHELNRGTSPGITGAISLAPIIYLTTCLNIGLRGIG
jgi:hypothetical protein